LKKISAPWQILGSFCFLTGLFAFRRIKKFRMGLVIYGLGYGVLWGSIATTSSFNLLTLNDSQLLGLLAFLLGGLITSVIVPPYFMDKWTKEYNKTRISSQDVSQHK